MRCLLFALAGAQLPRLRGLPRSAVLPWEGEDVDDTVPTDWNLRAKGDRADPTLHATADVECVLPSTRQNLTLSFIPGNTTVRVASIRVKLPPGYVFARWGNDSCTQADTNYDGASHPLSGNSCHVVAKDVAQIALPAGLPTLDTRRWSGYAFQVEVVTAVHVPAPSENVINVTLLSAKNESLRYVVGRAVCLAWPLVITGNETECGKPSFLEVAFQSHTKLSGRVSVSMEMPPGSEALCDTYNGTAGPDGNMPKEMHCAAQPGNLQLSCADCTLQPGNYSFGVVIKNAPTVPNPNLFTMTTRLGFEIGDLLEASGYDLTPAPSSPAAGSGLLLSVLLITMLLALAAGGAGVYMCRKRSAPRPGPGGTRVVRSASG
jgi:hypothetical protein